MPMSPISQPYTEHGASVLGLLLHQVRSFLAQFRNLLIMGLRAINAPGAVRRFFFLLSLFISTYVTHASHKVMQYQRERFDMLLKAGLRKLFEEREAVLERVG